MPPRYKTLATALGHGSIKLKQPTKLANIHFCQIRCSISKPSLVSLLFTIHYFKNRSRPIDNFIFIFSSNKYNFRVFDNETALQCKLNNKNKVHKEIPTLLKGRTTAFQPDAQVSWV